MTLLAVLVTDMLMLCVEVTGQSLPVQPLLDVVEVIVQDCSTSVSACLLVSTCSFFVWL